MLKHGKKSCGASYIDETSMYRSGRESGMNLIKLMLKVASRKSISREANKKVSLRSNHG